MTATIGPNTQTTVIGKAQQGDAETKKGPVPQMGLTPVQLFDRMNANGFLRKDEITPVEQHVITPLHKGVTAHPTHKLADIEKAKTDEETILHTWALQDGEVHLVRFGDELHSMISRRNGELKYGAIALPPNLAIEEAILKLKNMIPIVDANNQVRFTKKPEIEIVVAPEAGPVLPAQPVAGFYSQLDNDVKIDEDNWALTLVDSYANPELDNPLTWGGHANIFIEKVENRRCTLYKAHLFSLDNGLSKIVFKELGYFDPTKVASQTQTWVRSKENVEKMEAKIEQEIASQNLGAHQVQFNIRGNDLTIRRTAAMREDNCYTWAREKLRSAGVFLYEEVGGIRPLIVVPKSYISLNKLCAKENILIDVEGLNIVGYVSLYLRNHNSFQQFLAQCDSLNTGLYSSDSITCHPLSKLEKSGSFLGRNHFLNQLAHKVIDSFSRDYSQSSATMYTRIGSTESIYDDGEGSLDSRVVFKITEEIDKLTSGVPWQLVDGEYRDINPRGLGEAISYMAAKKVRARIHFPLQEVITREDQIAVEIEKVEFRIHVRKEGIRNINATDLLKKLIQRETLQYMNKSRGRGCVIQ